MMTNFLSSMRNRVCREIERLKSSPPEAFLNGAVDCHLRASAAAQKHRKLCQLCKVHQDIELYESLIFHFVKDEMKSIKSKAKRDTINVSENKKLEEAGVFLLDEQRKGTWADSETERLLRALLKFTRQRIPAHLALEIQSIQSDGANHMKMIEASKKEFKLLR